MSANQSSVEFKARGLIPPVFTPLNEDCSINCGEIAPYAKYLVDNGIKAVLVGGTTGQHMCLSVADRKKVVDEWVRVGKIHGLHIQVQVGGAALPDVINLAKYSESVGADSLLTLPELYFRPTNVEQLVDYLELVAKAAPNLPVLYYHIPHMSKVEVNMPAFVAAATARIPNFRGLKFSSYDLSEAAQVYAILQDGQELFLGAENLIAPGALLGIKSFITPVINLYPHLTQDVVDAVNNNEVAKGRALQQQLCKAIKAYTAEGIRVPVLKAAMEILTGIKVGPPSPPQKPVTAETRNKIQSNLRALGLTK